MFLTHYPRYLYALAIATVLGLAVNACVRKSSKKSDSHREQPGPDGHSSPSTTDTSATVSVANAFACGDLSCQLKNEFCVTQYFTVGGAAIKSACLARPQNCSDECDCAKDSLSADLKGLGSNCFNDQTKGELTLRIFNPEGLPLKDKVADLVAQGHMAMAIPQNDLLNKINAGASFYVEDGQIKGSPSTGLYCQMILGRLGFVSASVPNEFDKASFEDREMLGSFRQMTARLGSALFSMQCVRQDDLTPFTLPDLQKIFGGLASFPQ